MLEIENTERVSTELFTAVLNNVHAYVLLIDEDFRVLLTNYYDLRKTQESSKIKRVGDLLHCQNALKAVDGCGTHINCSSCSIRTRITKAFAEKGSFTNFESFISVLNNDGTLTDCDVTISARYLATEKKPMIVLTVHDVTEMKRIQSELELARRKSELDRTKSIFFANMNHEIRTPLNAIVGFSELLAYAESEEEKAQYLEIVQVNNRLLQQITNDILDIAKIEAGTLEFIYSHVDINTMISNVVQSIYIRLGDRIGELELIHEPFADKFTVFSDENRLMQVLTNFLTNAMKFTESGSIKVGCENRETEFYFYVTDTGNGIPEDNLPTIFERFMRVQKNKEGTGLGLAICKTIIDGLGGRIGVESKLSVGSTFWFSIPRE